LLALVAGMGWATRKGLAWRVSTPLDVAVCLAAWDAALARCGRPEICHTDPGSQVTSPRCPGVPQQVAGRIARDGRGRWIDHLGIERRWRRLQSACLYLQAVATGSALRAGLTRWIGDDPAGRPHRARAGRTPDEASGAGEMETRAA
jgi:putative transposase